jgi:AraC-like DNA-binding protein
MNTDAIRRFLTVLSSAVRIERGQLYQLIQSAEVSYCLRDIDSQREIGVLLQSFEYPFNQVGKYYESIYLYRTGQFEKARELLESVAESAPTQYRSKALLSLSTVEQRIGRFEESLRLRFQGSACDDPVTLLEAQRGIAILRSVEGDHRAALRDLERLMPLAHIIGKRGHPAYFAFLNSYALELSESDKNEEAEQVANIVAASPFINRYQEWRETALEVRHKRKRRSMVPVSLPQEPRMQKVIEFMRANLDRKISLSDMARIANVSQSHLSRLFKNQTRRSPGEFLIELRMKKANTLLLRTSLSIKEVRALVGYGTRSNFQRHFKQHFGIAPSEYRQRRRSH